MENFMQNNNIDARYEQQKEIDLKYKYSRQLSNLKKNDVNIV